MSMPAEMPAERPIAGIAGEPGGEEVAAAIRIVALVADVRDTMRAMRVLPVEHHGSFDLRSRLRDTAILAITDVTLTLHNLAFVTYADFAHGTDTAPGLALSFDDTSIDSWFALRPLFQTSYLA